MTSKEALDEIIRSFNETTTGINGLGEVVVDNCLIRSNKAELKIIKKDLERLEKLEKAIELLNDKLKFELAVYRNGGCTLKHYANKQTMLNDDSCLRHLEIEEYELLKEVLCDGKMD